MDLEKLKVLKEKLITDDSFEKVSKYFLDNFGENREFLDVGCSRGNEVIETALMKIGEYFCEKNVPILGLSLRYIEDYSFYHGCAMVGEKIASVFYFDDVHVGMINLIHGVYDSRVEFIRFTAFESKEGYFDISFGGKLPQ